MSRTQNFRRQHREIMRVASDIATLLKDPVALAANADECRLLLSELAGKLTVHLSMEDDAMYPRLHVHPDVEVRDLARRYSAEMGGIKKAFSDYAQRWRAARAIEAASAEFIAETNGIFAALSERIAKEDSELYPLVDKHG